MLEGARGAQYLVIKKFQRDPERSSWPPIPGILTASPWSWNRRRSGRTIERRESGRRQRIEAQLHADPAKAEKLEYVRL